MKAMKKCLALCLALGIVLAVFPMSAQAVSYEGKGTKSNPYLVETAQQLQAMGDNPSKHYKLNRTIDLTGISFKPIGYLAEPFTGTFICDTNADGTPKYIIKNLTVSVKGAPMYADYVENKSRWECGLFGATDGASLENIALYNVNMKNTVVGNNQMNADWTLNPGQDEMASAALIGIANNTVVTGCSATGYIDAASNHNGGLIGFAIGSKITGCYTDVTMKCSGNWHGGGLVGTLKNSTVRDSFAEGDLIAVGLYHYAGFVGVVTGAGSKIENCYSTGKIASGGGRESFVGTGAEEDLSAIVTGCYTTSVMDKEEGTQSNESSSNFALNVPGCKNQVFAPADKAKVEAGIAAIRAKISVITDYSAYEVGAVPPSTDPVPPPTEAVDPNAFTYEDFKANIDKYAQMAFKNEFTDEMAVEAVNIQDQYLELSDAEREKCSNADLSSMKTIKDKASLHLVRSFSMQIKELPAASEITPENAKPVNDLYKLFARLPQSVLTNFNAEVLEKLESAREVAKAYEGVTVLTAELENSFAQLEMTVVIILAVINLALIAGIVILIVRHVKNTKKQGG